MVAGAAGALDTAFDLESEMQMEGLPASAVRTAWGHAAQGWYVCMVAQSP